MTQNHALASFLYVLMRDHLPIGIVESLVQDHAEKCDGKVPMFSNQHLAAYAYELAGRIADECLIFQEHVTGGGRWTNC